MITDQRGDLIIPPQRKGKVPPSSNSLAQKVAITVLVDKTHWIFVRISAAQLIRRAGLIRKADELIQNNDLHNQTCDKPH